MSKKSYMITIVSDKNSWINAHLPSLTGRLKRIGHRVRQVHQVRQIPRGELVFFLGCGQMAGLKILARNKHNLVVHESALPQGKGWSPLTWQVLEGKKIITVSLFEAVAAVDSGRIYLQDKIKLRGNELVEDWRLLQAEATVKLCAEFVRRYPDIVKAGKKQRGKSTFYPKRGPQDSRLDANKTLRTQFGLLRTVDNERYPAFFEMNGETYILKISRKERRN